MGSCRVCRLVRVFKRRVGVEHSLASSAEHLVEAAVGRTGTGTTCLRLFPYPLKVTVRARLIIEMGARRCGLALGC